MAAARASGPTLKKYTRSILGVQRLCPVPDCGQGPGNPGASQLEAYLAQSTERLIVGHQGKQSTRNIVQRRLKMPK